MNYYKVSRSSADVDFLITIDGFGKIINLLKKEGFKIGCVQKVFARLIAEKPHLMDIDFMFVDEETLNKIIQEGKNIKLAGQQFIVPSLNHLIALKLHAVKYNPKAREFKDFLDIAELIKNNKVDVRNRVFRDLCLKYGTEGFYQKILAWFKQEEWKN